MMPIRMRRKTRGMEKVENLYCTARAQHVMPERWDHVVGSGDVGWLKPSRRSRYVASICQQVMFAAHDRGQMRIAAGHPDVESGAIPDMREGALGDPVIAPADGYHMSQFAAELCEYCAEIAPIVPSQRGMPQSLTGIRPSFLRCSAPRLRVRRSHQKES